MPGKWTAGPVRARQCHVTLLLDLPFPCRARPRNNKQRITRPMKYFNLSH
jgi:hypothetical protein